MHGADEIPLSLAQARRVDVEVETTLNIDVDISFIWTPDDLQAIPLTKVVSAKLVQFFL